MNTIFEKDIGSIRALTEAEFVENAKFFVYNNRVYKIDSLGFEYRRTVCAVFIRTPEQIFKRKMRFFRENGKNGEVTKFTVQNWDGPNQKVFIFNSKKGAVEFLQAELSYHTKVMLKYKDQFLKKEKKVKKLEEIFRLYPEYLL